MSRQIWKESVWTNTGYFGGYYCMWQENVNRVVILSRGCDWKCRSSPGSDSPELYEWITSSILNRIGCQLEERYEPGTMCTHRDLRCLRRCIRKLIIIEWVNNEYFNDRLTGQKNKIYNELTSTSFHPWTTGLKSLCTLVWSCCLTHSTFSRTSQSLSTQYLRLTYMYRLFFCSVSLPPKKFNWLLYNNRAILNGKPPTIRGRIHSVFELISDQSFFSPSPDWPVYRTISTYRSDEFAMFSMWCCVESESDCHKLWLWTADKSQICSPRQQNRPEHFECRGDSLNLLRGSSGALNERTSSFLNHGLPKLRAWILIRTMLTTEHTRFHTQFHIHVNSNSMIWTRSVFRLHIVKCWILEQTDTKPEREIVHKSYHQSLDDQRTSGVASEQPRLLKYTVSHTSRTLFAERSRVHVLN